MSLNTPVLVIWQNIDIPSNFPWIGEVHNSKFLWNQAVFYLQIVHLFTFSYHLCLLPDNQLRLGCSVSSPPFSRFVHQLLVFRYLLPLLSFVKFHWACHVMSTIHIFFLLLSFNMRSGL